MELSNLLNDFATKLVGKSTALASNCNLETLFKEFIVKLEDLHLNAKDENEQKRIEHVIEIYKQTVADLRVEIDKLEQEVNEAKQNILYKKDNT